MCVSSRIHVVHHVLTNYFTHMKSVISHSLCLSATTTAHLQSIYTATTMAATVYNCSCYKCNLEKQPITKRTIQDHWRKSVTHLEDLRASGSCQDIEDYVKYVEYCHYQTSVLLNPGPELSKQSGSPYSGGK